MPVTRPSFSLPLQLHESGSAQRKHGDLCGWFRQLGRQHHVQEAGHDGGQQRAGKRWGILRYRGNARVQNAEQGHRLGQPHQRRPDRYWRSGENSSQATSTSNSSDGLVLLPSFFVEAFVKNDTHKVHRKHSSQTPALGSVAPASTQDRVQVQDFRFWEMFRITWHLDRNEKVNGCQGRHKDLVSYPTYTFNCFQTIL